MASNPLLEKWKALPQKHRSLVVIVGLFGGMVLFGSIMVPNKNAPPPQKKGAPDVGVTSSSLVLPARRAVTQEEIAARVDSASKEMNELKEKLQESQKQNEALLQKVQQSEAFQEELNPEVVRAVAEMRRELDEMKAQKSGGGSPIVLPSGSGSVSTLDLPLPGGPMASRPPQALGGGAMSLTDKPVEESPFRLTVHGGATKKAEKTAAQKVPDPFLPAGAIFEGVLLNGMDAPTSSVTAKNPVPALVRVNSSSIIPNLMSMGKGDIRECFLVISGHGVMATERAQLRTETLSCVRENGQVIEADLDGYVVGEDGKVGVRGRLVSKQGSLLAKSLMAGFLSGVGNAVAPVQVPQISTDGEAYQKIDLGLAMQSGLASGVSESTKMVAQFYLDMAKEMFPVIEIDAGRKISIVTLKGLQLSPAASANVRPVSVATAKKEKQ